jgi:hypothetical protein
MPIRVPSSNDRSIPQSCRAFDTQKCWLALRHSPVRDDGFDKEDVDDQLQQSRPQMSRTSLAVSPRGSIKSESLQLLNVRRRNAARCRFVADTHGICV